MNRYDHLVGKNFDYDKFPKDCDELHKSNLEQGFEGNHPIFNTVGDYTLYKIIDPTFQPPEIPPPAFYILDGDKKYLSEDGELKEKLPSNCIFDKGKVGCGGTTIAINNPYDYVIAVPYVALIESKTSQHKDVFGVYAGVTTEEIQDYYKKQKASNKPVKYIVTYDSFDKIVNALGEEIINTIKLLVDEYHIFFMHYSFRRDAIRKVLNNYTKFEEYCFLSATPLSEDFILDELSDIRRDGAVWLNKEIIEVDSVLCRSVMASASHRIQQFLSGEIEGNAYFFLNSTESIKRLIEQNNLTEKNTRVIYSKSNNIDLSIKRSDINSKPKKINLLTSMAFEGADIYDENGKIFIISDAWKPHTLVDISTSFIQISGRIRNTQYSNRIVHLYNNGGYSPTDITFDDYLKSCKEEAQENQNNVKKYNGLSKSFRDNTSYTGSGYIIKKDDGYLEYDSNLLKLDLYKFKLTRLLYGDTSNLLSEYSDYGFTVNCLYEQYIINRSGGLSENRLSFRKKMIFLKESKYFMRPQIIRTEDKRKAEDILKREPIIKEMVERLGFDRIEELSYNKKNITAELIKLRESTESRKIADLLEVKGVKEGLFYTNSQIEEFLKSVYLELCLGRNPRANYITKYFTVKDGRPFQKRFEGKREWGYYIVRKKGNL